MKKLLSVLFAAPLVFASCATQSVTPGPTDTLALQDEGGMGMDEDMMVKMMAFGALGEAHSKMAHRVGTWNVKSTITMSPGASPMAMDSVSEIKMILGGRFLIEETKSVIMGMPYEGQLTMGFNNATKEWWTIWMDSMSTGFSSCKGIEGKDGVINMKGTMVDGMSPEGRPYRAVTTVGEKDETFVVTMYDTLPDGTEWSVMEMTYTRAEEKR